jgi:hypothetical protein
MAMPPAANHTRWAAVCHALFSPRAGCVYGIIPGIPASTRRPNRCTFSLDVWENALLRASGPRVEEGGLTLIPAYPYSAPYEELRLKR